MFRLLLWRHLVVAVSGILLVLMTFSLTMTPQTAFAKTSTISTTPNQPSTSANVSVSSNVVWQDTGITLSAGDKLTVSATGSWSADPTDGPTSPDGYTQLSADNFLNLTDIGVCGGCATTQTPHWGALIGYIGNNPPAAGSYTSTSILPEAQKVFVVGSNYQASAPLAGELWLTFNDDAYSANTGDNAGQVTATVTDTPLPLGGTWISPQNNFTITGNTLHLAAHAYGGAGVDHVNFTAYWSGVYNHTWYVECTVKPTPGTDMFSCDWNVIAMPQGPLTVSFDVYDTAGNRILAPNGTHQGTVNQTSHSKMQIPTYGYIGYLFHQRLAPPNDCLDKNNPNVSHVGIDIWTNQQGTGLKSTSPEGNTVWAAHGGNLIGIFDTQNNSVKATDPKASTLLIDIGVIQGVHIYMLYAHMANANGLQTFVDPGLYVGKSIAKGDVLGHQGNADKSTNPNLITHLHFEIKTTASLGNEIDPSPYLGRQVDRCNPGYPSWLANFP